MVAGNYLISPADLNTRLRVAPVIAYKSPSRDLMEGKALFEKVCLVEIPDTLDSKRTANK